MFNRQMEKTLRAYKKFPVVAILGPRQSGKTTLAKSFYSKHQYVSFENPRTRELAMREPEHFLLTYTNQYGIIIDEFQYVPEILSYIQLDVDEHKRKNYFVLTGSQNFLMNQRITQSFAGRVGILTLLPLSLRELAINKLLLDDSAAVIFNGFYPRLYDEQFVPGKLYPSYIQTYIERDVRQLVNVGDLSAFQKFLQLCAARIGNLLNLSDIAMACGVSSQTARRWLSILQASYIVFLLEPYYNNFNKRLTKMPKLYFYDTGLACSLLRIDSSRDLPLHSNWGSLFECFIIADIAKQYLNNGERPPFYFWRDKNGRIEIDCLIDDHGALFPIEIKGSASVTEEFFKGLKQWTELVHAQPKSFLVYAGQQAQKRRAGIVVPWKKAAELVGIIKKS